MAQRYTSVFELLVDVAEDRLAADEAQILLDQMGQGHANIQANLAWLKTFMKLSETTVLAAPPAVVRTLLTRRFAAYAEGRKPPTLFQRIAAVLTFDSGRSPAAAGARGVGTTELPRQLIFTAGLADIAINVQPRRHDSSLDISGQILPNGDLQVDSWSVQVLHDATELGLTTTDELGEWRIEQLPPGTYELILSAAELELVIPAVPLFP